MLIISLTVWSGVIPDMKFRRLDTREGLSNSTVNCIYRDSRGDEFSLNAVFKVEFYSD